MRVYYNPARPEKVVISSFWTLWAGPVFLTVLGLGFVAPSLAVLIARNGKGELWGQASPLPVLTWLGCYAPRWRRSR
jgi:hypothetical protein